MVVDSFESTGRPTQPPDSLAEQREVRLGIIKPVVDNRFPMENYLAIASQKTSIKVEDLDDNWRGWAKNQEKQYEHRRQELSNTITESSVSPKQTDEYLTVLTSTAKEIDTKKGGRDIQDIITLAKASDTIEKAKLWHEMIREWKSKFTTGIDNEVAQRRINDFRSLLTDLSGHNVFPRPPVRPIDEIKELMPAFSEVYGYDYSLPPEIKQGFTLKVITRTNETYERDMLKHMITRIVNIGLNNHDSNQMLRALNLLRNNQHVDLETLSAFIESVCHYGLNNGLTEEEAVGFQENLLPAFIKKDDQVKILIRGGNIWSMGKGETMGIGDFICHCYTTELNPPEINNLLLTTKEVPTTDYARFEQNRLDALTVGNAFGALRDFIHDQRPGVSEVIQAMVSYYQTGDKSRLETLLSQTGGYLASPERQAIILNRNNYEEEVEEWVGGQKQKVKTVEVLKRLAKNTKLVEDVPPTTSEPKLNEKMATLSKSRSHQKTRKSLGEAYDLVNSRLIDSMEKGKIGIGPNTVLALVWLEAKGFDVLQNLTYEDQMSAYKQKWFHSLLRFHELTSSPDRYDQEEFQSFLNQVNEAKSDKEAYELTSRRVLHHINILGRKYKSEGKKDRVSALWSGNSAHELIGLTDFKPAITAYGERHQKERLKPEQDRLKGD